MAGGDDGVNEGGNGSGNGSGNEGGNEGDQQGDQQGAIDATGCADLSDALLLCYDKHRDWRACRKEVEAFRRCYAAHRANTAASN